MVDVSAAHVDRPQQAGQRCAFVMAPMVDDAADTFQLLCSRFAAPRQA